VKEAYKEGLRALMSPILTHLALLLTAVLALLLTTFCLQQVLLQRKEGV
jgi:hypothetical protein